MSYNVDYPTAENHEIIPNLFLGGHVWQSGGKYRDGRHSKVSEDLSWDYVVSAYIEAFYEKTLPQCDSRLVIFNDTEHGLEDEEWDRIGRAVNALVTRWDAGDKVLVRCQAGLNRSSMIMGLALMKLGLKADDAIKLMRLKRSKDVLVNKVFEGYVREREAEYLNTERSLDPEWIEVLG